MPDGAGADVGLGNGPHLDGCLHPDGDALLLAHVRHGQAVHHRGQHAHVVGPGALHGAAAVFGAPPEVSAADYQAHLNTQIQALLDDVAHAADHLEIQSGVLISRQSFAADLQQDPLVNRLCHNKNLRCVSGIYTGLFYLIFPYLQRG